MSGHLAVEMTTIEELTIENEKLRKALGLMALAAERERQRAEKAREYLVSVAQFIRDNLPITALSSCELAIAETEPVEPEGGDAI
jgi:hypothetical protein